MRNLLIVAICFALNSCVAHQEYPSGWKPIQTTNNVGCPNLSGAYSNSGESSGNRYVPPLIEVLMSKFSGSADTIEIIESNESFFLAAIENGENKAKLELPKNSDDVYCKEGALIIEKGKVVNREGALGKEWDTFLVQKSAQGLVVNRHHGAVGVLFVVPIAGKESHWFLYKKT